MDRKANYLDGSAVESINRMEVLLYRARATARRAEERLRAVLGSRLRGPSAEPEPPRRINPPFPESER